MATEEKEIKNILVFHGNSRIKTIKEFLDEQMIYDFDPSKFLELNKQLIFDQMSFTSKLEYAKAIGISSFDSFSADSLKDDVPLPCPANFWVPEKNVTREVAINQTNLQASTNDFIAFANEKINEVLNVESTYLSDGGNSLLKREPKCKVYCWNKSLYYAGTDKSDYEAELGEQSQFLDISRYVMGASTLSSGDGGSFTIRLPILDVLTGKKAGTDFAEGTVAWTKGSFINFGKDIAVEDENSYLSKSDILSVERNFFSWLFSANDIVLMSFVDTQNTGEYVEAKDVHGQNFDMIGLVDRVNVIVNGENTSAYVEISGRDLNKLLIDDGSFFFQVSTVAQPSEIFANQGVKGDVSDTDTFAGANNPSINRLRLLSGEIEVFKSRVNMSLSYILKGVISQLANIEIVPGNIFKSWGADQTSFNELEPEKNGN